MITAFAANGAVCSALIGFTRLSLSLSRSFIHSSTDSHSPIHSAIHPLPFVLSLARWSAYSHLSFHSRDNFPHPSSSGEEKKRNRLCYLDIATFYLPRI